VQLASDAAPQGLAVQNGDCETLGWFYKALSNEPGAFPGAARKHTSVLASGDGVDARIWRESGNLLRSGPLATAGQAC